MTNVIDSLKKEQADRLPITSPTSPILEVRTLFVGVRVAASGNKIHVRPEQAAFAATSTDSHGAPASACTHGDERRPLWIDRRVLPRWNRQGPVPSY